MELVVLLGLGFLGFLIASAILPWINRGRIKLLSEEVERLRGQVLWLVSLAREKRVELQQETFVFSKRAN